MEHLTDIGRIVMEKILNNITSKGKEVDPTQGQQILFLSIVIINASNLYRLYEQQKFTLIFLEISRAKVDALFQSMELVAGRMLYLMSLNSNKSSRVTFDVDHAMTVEIVSEYLNKNNAEVIFLNFSTEKFRFFKID